jgi:EAL domain-containing protein (putative c-di-GMP-specific phosphodiesterase class I)
VDLKATLKNDLVWRPLAAVMIIAAAWGLHVMINQHGQTKVYGPLESSANKLAKNVDGWLDDKARQAELLSKDPRLKQAFDASDWRGNIAKVRRTIYEFSYLNEIKNVYAVNPKKSPHLVKTAGAPAIPLAIFKLLMGESKDPAALMVNVSQKPQLLVMLPLFSEGSNKAHGYVAYLENLKSAIGSLESPSNKKKIKRTLALFRERGDGKVAALVNTAEIKISTLAPADTTLPIFASSGGTGQFMLTENVLASVQPVSGQPGWYAAAYRSVLENNPENDLLRWIIKILAAVMCILLFVIPGKGEYAKVLKKAGVLPKPKGEDSVDVTTPSSLEEALGGAFAAAGVEFPDEDGSIVSNHERARKIYEQTQNNIANQQQKLYASALKEGKTGELSDNVILYIIRKSITDKNIRLLYQPIINAADNSIAMYEVFLRLLDEDGTMLPPGQFMPVAEKHNIMSELDEAVINKVMEDFFDKNKLPPAPLSINLSGDTFDSLGYMNKIVEAAANGKIPPGQIAFELRSSEIIADKKAMRFVRECRDMGFKFSMDYFGGGTQVLQAAKTLKFDYAKIDSFRFKGFTRNAEVQKELARLALVSKEIKMPIILERVESPIMDEFSRKLGVRYLQGYRYGEPSQKFAKSIKDSTEDVSA